MSAGTAFAAVDILESLAASCLHMHAPHMSRKRRRRAHRTRSLRAHSRCALSRDGRSCTCRKTALSSLQLLADRQARTPELCANPAAPSQLAVSTLRSQQCRRPRAPCFSLPKLGHWKEAQKLQFCNHERGWARTGYHTGPPGCAQSPSSWRKKAQAGQQRYLAPTCHPFSCECACRNAQTGCRGKSKGGAQRREHLGPRYPGGCCCW